MFKILAILPIALLEVILGVFFTLIGTMVGFMSAIRIRVFRSYDYRNWLKRDLADCDVILELGCGRNSPLVQIGDSHRTDAFDIWQPCVDMHNRTGSYRHCYQADILKLALTAKYDAVVICDVLEHLAKDEAIDLLDRIENCATKKVIIFTPNGFIENDEGDGDPYQAHLSAWGPADYSEREYKVAGATGLRWLFGKAALPKYRPRRVCAIIAMLSKPLVFHRPEWAFHSYAVKEINHANNTTR